MNRKFLGLLCFSISLLLPLASPLFAKDEEKSGKSAPRKAPVLSMDSSPVTQNAKGIASYADVLEGVEKAVVSVYSSKNAKPSNLHPMLRQFFDIPDQEQPVTGLGSGVVISADGYILTNNHVIEGADKLNVQLYDNREFIAEVIGKDPKTDIAVIKIDAEGLPCATLADSDKLRVGDVVFALGNPLGVGQTVTMGIVSAVGRSNLRLIEDGTGYESFIQTDAAINMGNSGGALVDAKGRLVGINTAILSPSRGNIGIGFSVPVNLAASILHSLIQNNGVVQRGMLGVVPSELSAELAETLGLKKGQKGVLVSELKPEDGPAGKAGIKREDVIVAVNDKPITTPQELRISVAPLAPGSIVKVKILRDGKEKVYDVTLGMLDADRDSSELLEGVKVAPLSPELRKQYGVDRRIDGLVIQEISDDSPFADRLAVGVVIIEINRKPFNTVVEARAAIKKGRSNLFYIYYRGGLRYIALAVP